MASCGLDFGTSNTTLGVPGGNGPSLARLEHDDVTIPSAIFFAWNGDALIGRAAVSAYVDGAPGRLMRSLKSALGGSLIDETTQIGRKRLRFTEVIARYIALVKARAEADGGAALDSVVHGRPVHFVDSDPDGDRKAEDALRGIAESIGFKHVSFQFEPIAAALDYERQVRAEEIALVVDIGGGTSDFSLVRLSPDAAKRNDRASDVLANDGVRVGGVDFDRELSLASVMPHLGYRSPMKRAGVDAPAGYFHDLATWASINRLYSQKILQQVKEIRRDSARPDLIGRLLRVLESQRGHSLAIDVERAKIALSDAQTAHIALDWLADGLQADASRPQFIASSARLTQRITDSVVSCLNQAGLGADKVDALFLTGGTTRIPHVREAILAMAPRARVVEGDTFGSVGMGLTIEAARRYG
ncbi:MAG: heat-shock protein [Hyphomicrobiales bacterium]|nr:heat-shock protein [Hyphomicrobiales bacterium]